MKKRFIFVHGKTHGHLKNLREHSIHLLNVYLMVVGTKNMRDMNIHVVARDLK